MWVFSQGELWWRVAVAAPVCQGLVLAASSRTRCRLRFRRSWSRRSVHEHRCPTPGSLASSSSRACAAHPRRTRCWTSAFCCEFKIFMLNRLACTGSFLALMVQGTAFANKKKPTELQCYIWGNGYYQARPGASGISFSNFTPKLVTNLTSLGLAKLFFNQYFEGGITTAGEVYLWDTHRLSSSVDPDIDDQTRKNIRTLPLPDKSGAKAVKFTKGFIWVLTGKGEVYQYPIETTDQTTTFKTTFRKIQSLSKIKQIDTGEDHFVAVSEGGQVYTMGDDSMGQCGLGSNKRSTAPPFYEARIRNPTQIATLPAISKWQSEQKGYYIISKSKGVYGWGSNSKMQLSQQQEFSRVDEPLISVYQPIRISSGMDSKNKVVDVSLGDEFSVFVTENHTTGETEVFGCGHNLKGELGVGFIRHLTDIVKIEGLSNYKVKSKTGEEHVRIKQIECGKHHCMALTSIGALLEWGDNEHGQMGNKKRSVTENPIIMNTFSKENVFSIACGHLQSGAIVQRE